jgi:heparinase II/III-like protein
MRNPSRRQFVALTAATPLAAQSRLYEAPRGKHNHPGRNLLSGLCTEASLATQLLTRSEWTPFPKASDRAGWNALPADARAALAALARKHLAAPWPELPATYFLDYVRIGNRTKADNARRLRRNMLRELTLGECVEHKGRYLEAILNGIWLTCEETYWGSPAHLTAQKAGSGLADVEEPTVDLFAADTAASLAWIDYLLGAELDDLSPLIRPRIWYEVNRRVLAPCEERDDFWWMGLGPGGPARALNNWTPWICSNWLAANLLLEPDEARRRKAVHRALRSTDLFLESYHDDGGCDEGPGYWGRAGGSLFDCLELLHSASAGNIYVYDDPLIGEIGRYIYRAHIHEAWYVNFADASAQVTPDGSLVYRYGQAIDDGDMQGFGAWIDAKEREGRASQTKDFSRELMSLSVLNQITSAPAKQPLLRDVWMPGIGMMAARSAAGSPKGLYVAAHGGHNAESHNHNDVGDFIVYADGQPAIIDVGVETYSAKTFSSRRYEIWTMQSAWHNLPTVGGVMQYAGRDAAARDMSYAANDDGAELKLDIAGAYQAAAGVDTWRRSIRLDRRSNQVSITDTYSLNKDVPEITLTLMTVGPVKELAAGKLQLAGVTLAFDPALLTPEIEPVTVTDPRLRRSWPATLYRILLRATRPQRQGTLTLTIAQQAT